MKTALVIMRQDISMVHIRKRHDLIIIIMMEYTDRSKLLSQVLQVVVPRHLEQTRQKQQGV